jgi:hypothetical protein
LTVVATGVVVVDDVDEDVVDAGGKSGGSSVTVVVVVDDVAGGSGAGAAAAPRTPTVAASKAVPPTRATVFGMRMRLDGPRPAPPNALATGEAGAEASAPPGNVRRVSPAR